MKRSLFVYLLVAASVSALVSCSEDATDYGDEVVIEGDYRKPPTIADGEKITFPVWVSDGLSTDFSDVVRGRMTQTATSADDAMVVVTDMNGYSGLDVRRDRIVIVYRPSESLLKELGEETGDILCVAFQQGRSGNCVVLPPSDGLEVDECLNGVVVWTNNAIKNATGNFDPSSFWEESSLSTTYSNHLNEEITHVIGSSHDYLEGSYSVEVQLKVTPMHGFESSESKAMDYYLMTSTVSIASGKMYTGNFVKMHGGVKARICGFYLKSLSANFTIVNTSGVPVGQFAQIPSPETVVGSTGYTTGWSFSVGGGITGGTVPMPTSSVGVSVSSSTSRTISDCDVLNRHEGATVGYDYLINNLPRLKYPNITDPPLVSTSTINFYSQWVWAVPTEDYDVKTKYRVMIDIYNHVYGASYFYTGVEDYHDLEFPQNQHSVIKDLPIPNRGPTGKFELTNTEEGTFVTNIRLYNKDYPETGSYHDESTYGQGNTCSLFLVAGDYELQCDIKGTDGRKRTRKYTKLIRVLPGGSVKLSTGYGFN